MENGEGKDYRQTIWKLIVLRICLLVGAILEGALTLIPSANSLIASFNGFTMPEETCSADGERRRVAFQLGGNKREGRRS